ncbi:hypothetical protein O181_112906 [Austropuccinia psidii MF-1]|uniref:Uncharacterized protein n=1 Tax=Austropuccinia psidii MF-1 TaxID=1389203 RepID=A0A9Q3K3W8_9BASI|nr:hypothetical protein [Austropuccinia psidii MF-1]
MPPTRGGSNYSVQSNGSGPGNSSHKSKRQECQPIVEAQTKDARSSTSSQRLSRTSESLIESPGTDITVIGIVRPEPFSTRKNRDIPVSVQDLIYGRKETRVGTSVKSLHRYNELIYSSEELHGPRKDRGSSQGLHTHVLQEKSPTDNSLVEKPKYFVSRPEEEVF